MPPSHSEILPLALAAFSAPNGVSDFPSWAASSGVAVASAAALANARPAARTRKGAFMVVLLRWKQFVALHRVWNVAKPARAEGAMRACLRVEARDEGVAHHDLAGVRLALDARGEIDG